MDNTGPNAIITVSGAAMTPDQYAGNIVVPNTARADYNYKIIGNTANTLTVKGLVNTTYAAAGNLLGISYGKFIRATINLSDIGKPAESKTVRLFKPAGVNSFADGDPAAIDGICEVCHTQTSAWHNDGTLAGVAAHSGLKGSNCISCHPHSEGFRAVYECLDCHADAINSRAAVGQQFSGNSHHVQTGSTITSDKCYQCHWEADATGKLTGHHSAMPGAAVDLVIYGSGTRPETYTAGSTAVAYTADGSRSQILSINSHCLGCHSDQNNSTQPFGDGKTPKQYAWDGTSVDARYSQTGTTPWGKYSGANTTPKNPRAKAFSAHGNAVNNQGGWNLSETWPNTRNGAVNVACFDCHNSHGSTAEGATTSYASATANGGILKSTASGKGGYGVDYQPAAGGSAANKNLRNSGASLCFDCHLSANGATDIKPWGYQSTFGASQAIIGYFDSEFLEPGLTGSQQRYAYKGVKKNAGGHFGASSPLSSTPMQTINGLCTPCHDPHGVSPTLGSVQQYGVPMLKGTWLTSPYKEDAAPTAREYRPDGWSGGSTPGYHIDQNTFATWNFTSTAGISQDVSTFGGLCLQCHAKAGIDADATSTWGTMDRVHETVKGWGANSKHSFPCSKCHSAHNGSALPRLMVTNCLDFRHRGRVGAGGVPGNHSAVVPSDDCDLGGEGSGKFPGGGHGSGEGCESSGSNSYGFGGVACHDNVNSGASWPDNQLWNPVTTWEDNTPMPPQTPILIAEPDWACTSATCTTTLSWNIPTSPAPDGDPVQFFIQVDDNADFSSVNYSSTWLPGTTTSFSFTAPNTTNGKTWYWRAQARDAVHIDQISPWSSIDDYIIRYEPPRPNRFAEPDLNCGSSCLVTLQWGAVTILDADPAEYSVEVDNTADFSSPEHTSGWITGVTFDVTLVSETTWYWRVRARDTGHTFAVSQWSLADSFILTARPPQPVLIAEPDSRCAPNCEVTLEWNGVSAPDGDPVEYFIQINSVNRSYNVDWSTYGDADLQQSGWISGTSWTVTVDTDKTWYWHVRSRDAVHTTLVSTSWTTNDSFVTIGNPEAPILVAEPDIVCAAGACLDLTLNWNAVTSLDGDPIEYFVQVDNNADFSSPEYVTPAWTTDIFWNVTVATESSYYWRVQARDSGHPAWISSWSNADSLIVASSDSPPAPTGLTDPGTYNSDVSTVVNLSWNAVTDPNGDPVQYQVQVSWYPAFDSIQYDSGWISATNWSLSVSSCSGWYWRVRARDAFHVMAMSNWSTSATYFYDVSASCDTSCPVLFTWDGEKFAFESDIYPAGKLGNLEPDGFRKPNPHDYYLLNTDPVLLNGRYELRLVEERREANYFDTATLYTVDFPVDRDLYAERLHVNLDTYFEPGEVLHTTAKELQVPVSAIHVETGEDVTAVLSQADDDYVALSNDRNLDFGWQTLEIDLGDLSGAPMVKLIIEGQTAFPITHEGHMVASQEPRKSTLQVLDAQGRWIGVPMKDRSMVPREDGGTIAVDITNIFKTDIFKIRIGYFYKTYINAIRFDTTMDEPVTIQEVPLASAELRHHGHDKKYGGEIGEYVYGDINNPGPEYLPGSYTRFGGATSLLDLTDDKFIIFGSGDEVALRFYYAGEVPAGAARRFLLYSNGYYKSLSNNNVPHTVEPLPFAAMSNFPYDPAVENYPG